MFLSPEPSAGVSIVDYTAGLAPPVLHGPLGDGSGTCRPRVVIMKQRKRVPAVVTGATFALVGGLVTVVYLFQPWRTCPYDDSPAACAMLPADAMVLAVAVCSTLIGVLILVLGLLLWRGETAR